MAQCANGFVSWTSASRYGCIFQQGGHDMFYGAGGIVLLIVIILFLTGRL